MNYWTQIWKLNYNQSRAGWRENNKDKKNEGIDKAEKKLIVQSIFCPENYFVRQKGIYHQVEFCPKLFVGVSKGTVSQWIPLAPDRCELVQNTRAIHLKTTSPGLSPLFLAVTSP